VAALLDAIITQPECFEIHRHLPDVTETLKDYLSNATEATKARFTGNAALTERNGFEGALETVDHALKYEATDIDSLINLHNRIYSQVLSWLHGLAGIFQN